ncbi:jg3435 [Pararge aegeria aegeria]|uniref:Jg3435 protein n=1 Tax=Pararge aegeria aegeria TaxID=348720 RepID=A0A8S4RS98_9NEOP|nr:jg3435 [Pararge aegeria aegeria]
MICYSGYGQSTLLGEPLDVGILRCWNGDLAPVYVGLMVNPRRGGRTTSSELQGAVGPKRHKTVGSIPTTGQYLCDE